MFFTQFITFAVSFLLLAWASRILVGSLTRMARFLQISEYALSFIVMGFATSVPEIFLAVSSGIGGVPSLSFGNIIGANILNVTLLIGLVAIVGGGIRTSEEIKNNTASIFLVLILPFLLIYDGSLDWLDGLVLIGVYFWYLARLMDRKHKFEQTGFALAGRGKERNAKPAAGESLPAYSMRGEDIVKQVVIMLGAAALLLGASFLIINAARPVAELLRVGLLTLGIFVVAVGTTVPELAFGIRSVILKHDEMTVGNALGSVAVNSTLVLGIASVLSPIEAAIEGKLLFSIGFLVVAFWSLKLLLGGGKIAITRKEGIALIALYAMFIVLSVVIG